MKNEFTGVLTGKGVTWGGSLIRPEATGYGVVYFAEKMLEFQNKSIRGKKVVISGSGNVAQYAAEKVIQLGGTVISLSDSSGFIFDSEGINSEKLNYIMEIKNVKRKRISEYKSIYIPDVILEDMSMDSGDNVVWFQNDDGHYLIKKVQVDILD